ncbi:G-protein coupled receptor 4-like [Oryzias melastigma]|uniref:G-protein coupled receptor 4-like n=1 Tax=Oryzias melastigma TaxID=30732 RepID=UPI000CF7E494|nr:G-protein coupled receptor 4-like [Oryzias melastigma]
MENQTSSNFFHQNITYGCYEGEYAIYVSSLFFAGVGLPLALVAIIALRSVVRADHVAPVYVINLLISDLLQLCCTVVFVATNQTKICEYFRHIFNYGLMVSICFMVIISLERYLTVAWPLWYRLRRNIRTSVKICIVAWLICLSLLIINALMGELIILMACLLILPVPLFIFSLWGTVKALNRARSVQTDEKRRIIAVLVLVLIIYALLFLPDIIFLSSKNKKVHVTAYIFLHFSPLADLVLYIFMRKGIGDKILDYLCCKMMPDSFIQSGQNSAIMELGSPVETWIGD